MKRYHQEVVIEEYLVANLSHGHGAYTRLKFRNHEWRRTNERGADWPTEDAGGRRLFPQPIPVEKSGDAFFKLFEFINDYNVRKGWRDEITFVTVGLNRRAILDMDHEVFIHCDRCKRVPSTKLYMFGGGALCPLCLKEEWNDHYRPGEYPVEVRGLNMTKVAWINPDYELENQ